MNSRNFCWLLLSVLILSGAGCGNFAARRMAQAPNTYPDWLAPKVPVELGFSPKLLTNFPARWLEVSPPPARLRYRLVEPGDYDLRVSSTNWQERGRNHFKFTFRATVPAPTNHWTAHPRGTVVLLHGYGLGQFAMAPWALRLAEEGWRCLLVDLRGHGRSTGHRIYFGAREAHDLSQLLDELARSQELAEPVSVVGESYGAALALRWKGCEPRIHAAIAITPYAGLSNAVLNIAHVYARWMPKAFLNAGLRQLPSLLQVQPGDLDPTHLMEQKPITALFIAGAKDNITPVPDVARLQGLADPASRLLIVPGAAHEAITYFFGDLAPPIVDWLKSAP